MTKLRILDLYCGGGGAGMGYSLAGFDVVGVDINRQSNYPFDFIQADCLSLAPEFLAGFDTIHASPPCQAYTRKAADWGRERKHWIEHPDLLAPTRAMPEASGKPYVLENVPGSPIRADLTLCGSMFGLRIIKHRNFELNWPLAVLLPSCDHSDVYNPWQGKGRSAQQLRDAQGIDWLPMSGGASRRNGYTGDLFNAIPPAYTKFIGGHLAVFLNREHNPAHDSANTSPGRPLSPATLRQSDLAGVGAALFVLSDAVPEHITSPSRVLPFARGDAVTANSPAVTASTVSNLLHSTGVA